MEFVQEIKVEPSKYLCEHCSNNLCWWAVKLPNVEAATFRSPRKIRKEQETLKFEFGKLIKKQIGKSQFSCQNYRCHCRCRKFKYSKCKRILGYVVFGTVIAAGICLFAGCIAFAITTFGAGALILVGMPIGYCFVSGGVMGIIHQKSRRKKRALMALYNYKPDEPIDEKDFGIYLDGKPDTEEATPITSDGRNVVENNDDGQNVN